MAEKERIACCAGCKHYLLADEAGSRCPGGECGRRLRLRLAYICHDCDEAWAFFDGGDYETHRKEQHDA